jgi:putative hydrolase of the HAD superfamily
MIAAPYVVPRTRIPMTWSPVGIGDQGFGIRKGWTGIPVPRSPIPGRRHRRGLILDLDDTLYRRKYYVRSGFTAVAHHLGQIHGIQSQDAFTVMAHALSTGNGVLPFQAVCEHFGLPAEIIPSLVQVFRAHRPALWLHSDVADTLRRLRVDGWALVILTNGLPSVQALKVAALGLEPFVDGVVYAEQHAPGGKPSPEPFRAALRLLSLPAARCVSVGDDVINDVHAAKSLGIATIRVVRPDLLSVPEEDADIVITALPQLPDAASLLMTLVGANVA